MASAFDMLGPMREPDELDRRATAAVAAAHSKVCIAEDKVQRMIVDALAAERARVVGLREAAERMLMYVAGDSTIAMTDAVHDLAAALNRMKETDTTAAPSGPAGGKG